MAVQTQGLLNRKRELVREFFCALTPTRHSNVRAHRLPRNVSYMLVFKSTDKKIRQENTLLLRDYMGGTEKTGLVACLSLLENQDSRVRKGKNMSIKKRLIVRILSPRGARSGSTIPQKYIMNVYNSYFGVTP